MGTARSSRPSASHPCHSWNTRCIGATFSKSRSDEGGLPHAMAAALTLMRGAMARASIEMRRINCVTCSLRHRIHASSSGAGTSVRPVARWNRATLTGL